jgi:hypothetical protein
MNGESPGYVKDQLGHSSIKMTVDIYGHWILVPIGKLLTNFHRLAFQPNTPRSQGINLDWQAVATQNRTENEKGRHSTTFNFFLFNTPRGFEPLTLGFSVFILSDLQTEH